MAVHAYLLPVVLVHASPPTLVEVHEASTPVEVPEACLDDANCLQAPNAHGSCRIHVDSATWSDYPWRNAYTPTHDAASFVTHEYAYCSAGKGPWAFTSSALTVEECAAKCASLPSCKCFDYMCLYHEAANCSCPHIPPVHPTPNATKVACVGDSITAGYLSSCGLNYPNQLQSLLGDGFAVSNYGVGGTTLLRKGDNPYWKTPAFRAAAASDADVVILMLGTNDAKVWNWGRHAAEYPGDYHDLISVFSSMPSKPRIRIMTPPPLYQDGRYGSAPCGLDPADPIPSTRSYLCGCARRVACGVWCACSESDRHQHGAAPARAPDSQGQWPATSDQPL